MFKFPVFIVLLLLSFTGFANSSLQISVDLESARANVAVLGKKSVSDQALNQLADLYGNQQLIRKVKGYSGAGREVFISTLKELVTTGAIKGNDPYDWRSVQKAAADIKALITRIDADTAGFLRDIKAMIAPYAPAGLDITVKACFLAGGGALGFTWGGEPTFNVAMHKLHNDLPGTKLLVAHELYHIVQYAGQAKLPWPAKDERPQYLQATEGLLENLWSEGTANLVGDFTGVTGGSDFAREQITEFTKNSDRRRENFALFEAILYKSYWDTASHRYEQHYNICFSTAFDETAYFTGYEMAKAIQQYHGKEAVAAQVLAHPLLFIDSYIKLYKEVTDKKLIRFDASTEKIVEELMALRKQAAGQ
ncbi:DUF5700 domain-containing putative Zn-dependent protease [Paraflavitalea pollutisoli]|uniref:DUF5700 domain-containing putative Zn-dependent protease n=1 Tax=Paraflavitalea pollutisoli TaxID=3034143 RepID=UPI0023EBF8C2|nr:DUF5700 domain-containing putative Zn-dependent protease [Paraflavitalea sp. H1-2-19X]